MSHLQDLVSITSNPDGYTGGSIGGTGSCTRYIYGGCLQGCGYIPPQTIVTPDFSDTYVFNDDTMSNYVTGWVGTGDTESDGRCLYPQWSGNTIGCDSNEGSAPQDSTTCGTVDYQGTIFSKCEPSGLIGGLLVLVCHRVANQEMNLFLETISLPMFRLMQIKMVVPLVFLLSQTQPMKYKHLVMTAVTVTS